MNLTNHTWYNKHAHIFRKDGRVVRALLKQLVIEKGGIYLTVSFVDRGQCIKTKQTSAITVAALQVLWMNVDVVSDVESLTETDDIDTFIPPPECDRLPPLEIWGIPSTSNMSCLLMQVNNFLRLAGNTAVPATPEPMSRYLNRTPSPSPTSVQPRRQRPFGRNRITSTHAERRLGPKSGIRSVRSRAIEPKHCTK
jgi:hypothetical protein